jgi:hypothetical protein
MHGNKDKNKDDANSGPRRAGIVLLFVLLLTSATAFAHPMGNFSVNH